jgi:hypothetical protein
VNGEKVNLQCDDERGALSRRQQQWLERIRRRIPYLIDRMTYLGFLREKFKKRNIYIRIFYFFSWESIVET